MGVEGQGGWGNWEGKGRVVGINQKGYIFMKNPLFLNTFLQALTKTYFYKF